MSDGRYKEREKDDDAIGGGLDLDIPDISNAMKKLDTQIATREEVAKQHISQSEEEEKEEKAGKRKPRQKPKNGVICFCGNPHCRIGEFVETTGQPE